MDITPPTDNLYKFMAVGGIVLIVAGFIFPPVLFRETGMEYLAQLRGKNELKVHEEFTRQRSQTLDSRKQQAIDEKSELQKRLDSASNSAEVDRLEGRIKEANRAIESMEDASQELNLNLALKQAQIQNEATVSFNRQRDSRRIMLLGWIVALIGLGFSFFGFRWWYKHLQWFQDLQVAREAEETGATVRASTMANQKFEQRPSLEPTQEPVSSLRQPTQVDLPQPTK